jgi:hypothetical protein
MRSEVLVQNNLLDQVSQDVESGRDNLNAKSKAIKETRSIGDDFCWMYLVIAGEVLLMIMLIYMGLS